MTHDQNRAPRPDRSPTRRSDPRWADQRQLLVDLAAADLEGGGDVRPTMVAFAGDEPLVLITLRPFAKGDHHDPIIEAGAVALALGADRVLLSLTGRAWSLRDPIPPVLPDGPDLRQRVLVVQGADATGGRAVATSAVWPLLDRDPDACTDADTDDAPVLGDPVEDDHAVGWVPRVLEALVQAAADEHDRRDGDPGRPDPADPHDRELALQVVRCEDLGHVLAWPPATAQRVLRAVDALVGVATGPAARRGS